jgi:hypothetical protein
MRTTPALAAIGGLLLLAWSCNVQPGGAGPEPAAEPPGTAPSARLKPEPGAAGQGATAAASRRRLEKIQPIHVPGPKASTPAPLPRADKVLAVFHSGNVDGEVDPCG